MHRFAIAILLVLMPEWSMAAVRLQYLPAIPIQFTSKLTLEIQESLPILNMTTKGNQVLKFYVVLKKEGSKPPINQLPLSMMVTLKDLFLFLNVNGSELTFDPRGENVSVPFIQLAQLIDRPIALKIDDNGYVVEEGNTFDKLYKQMPALKDLSFKILLNDLFFHLFVLCGHDLTEGVKFQKASSPDFFHSLPSLITYDVVEINSHDVLATMKGTIAPKKLQFDLAFPEDHQSMQKVEMVLSGNLEGNISWNRSNAMLYTLENRYHYLAEMKFAEMRWTVQMTVIHAASSLSP